MARGVPGQGRPAGHRAVALRDAVGAVHILVVAAVMPAVLRDLGNLPLYGWAFSAAALAMIGTIPDRRRRGESVRREAARGGDRRALPRWGCRSRRSRRRWRCWWWDRFVQGAASGSAYALSLGTVAKTLSPSVRPRVLALMATSWLLPACSARRSAVCWPTRSAGDGRSWCRIPFLVLSVLMIYPVLRNDAEAEAAPAHLPRPRPHGRHRAVPDGRGPVDRSPGGRPRRSGSSSPWSGCAASSRRAPSARARGAPAAAICAFLLSLGFHRSTHMCRSC